MEFFPKEPASTDCYPRPFHYAELLKGRVCVCIFPKHVAQLQAPINLYGMNAENVNAQVW